MLDMQSYQRKNCKFPQHHLSTSYQYGCRCEDCVSVRRKANREYERNRRQRKPWIAQLQLVKKRESSNLCVVCGLSMIEQNFVCGFCMHEAQFDILSGKDATNTRR